MKLKISKEVMQSMGWDTGKRLTFKDEKINEMLKECKFNKKSDAYVLQCTEIQAECISEAIYDFGAYSYLLENPEDILRGKLLLNSVDWILEQVEEYNT